MSEQNLDRFEATNLADAFETLTAQNKNMISQFNDRLERIEVERTRGQALRMIDGGRSVISKDGEGQKSLAGAVAETQQYKSFMDGASDRVRIKLEAPSFKALLTGDGVGGPEDTLVRTDRWTSIVDPDQRLLTIRDLIPSFPTSSNAVEYTRETAYTNSAAEQGAEGTAKAESELSFELEKADVATIAHFMNVSRQALSDSEGLESYLNTRLIYGLELKTEEALISGAGTIQGFMQAGQHVGFNRPFEAGDTKIDTLAKAQTQLQLSDSTGNTVVLNPADWEEIRLLKETNSGQYLNGYPSGDLTPRLWGMRVIVTNSIDEGEFMVMDSRRAAVIFDRQAPTVELSRHHDVNFTSNIVTILVEQRLALAVIRPSSVVYGTFSLS